MEIDRKELKRRARQAIRKTKPPSWLVALAYVLLTTGIAVLLELLLPGGALEPVSLFGQILLSLWGSVIGFGLLLWALWTWRGLDPDLGALFQGFSIAGRVVILKVLIALRIMAWAMLAGLGYSLLASILLPFLLPDSVLGYLAVVFLPIYAIVLSISLRYAMAPYILADHPDNGSAYAIFHSVAMMRGRKWELFKLYLSFWPWYLLSAVLTLATFLVLLGSQGFSPLAAQLPADQTQQLILALQSLPSLVLATLVTLPVELFLLPYTKVSEAGFYDALSQIPTAAPGGVPPEMPPL